jgi:hypothetical protein
MNKSGEKASAHRLTKMNQLITSGSGKLGNGSCSFNNHISIGIHAQSFANIHKVIDVWPHAIEHCSRNNNGHNFS